MIETDWSSIREALLSGERGIYLLYGESGTGKSARLKETLRGRKVLWLSSEQMKEMIMAEVFGAEPIPTDDFDYAVIDNIEDIVSDAMEERFSRILDRWVDAGLSVALTECRARSGPLPTRHEIRKADIVPQP